MKYMIVVEDTTNGIDIRADLLQTPNELAGGHVSQAVALGSFLTHAAEVWVATQHMEMPQTQAFIASITADAPVIN